MCSLTANGTTRYNDMLRNIKGISNTMLSKSLKELEDDELVKRFEYLEIPVRVEYKLTEKAVKLQPILLELIQWEIARENKTSVNKNEKVDFFYKYLLKLFSQNLMRRYYFICYCMFC